MPIANDLENAESFLSQKGYILDAISKGLYVAENVFTGDRFRIGDSFDVLRLAELLEETEDEDAALNALR